MEDRNIMENLFPSKNIEEILLQIEKKPSHLIMALQAIQESYRYLPSDLFLKIAQHFNISLSQVMSVATFYNQFRLQPCGKHLIKVCIGTACHVAGAETVWEGFRKYLGLQGTEDTDKDMQFTVEKVACLGCCMMAPVVQIGKDMFGWVKPDQARKVIDDFLSQEKIKKDAITQIYSSKKSFITKAIIKTCLCSSCLAAGAQEIYTELQQQIIQMNLFAQVQPVGCLGISYHSPVVEIETLNIEENNNLNSQHFFYGNVRPNQVRTILLQHLRPYGMMRIVKVQWQKFIEKIALGNDQNSIVEQKIPPPNVGIKIALEHAGNLDPLDLQAYKKMGGFISVEKCLEKNNPEDILREIFESGLRGRGGAGFPTAEKWQSVHNAKHDIKYIIANGDEGDPGAFMDRMILESFPLRVLEGMIIAAWYIRANKGILYIRAEYPLAVQRIRQAIEICQKHRYLGKNICGSNFSLELEVITGAGAFVCGEETALIASLEGNTGRPRYRPPYPSEKGLYGCPTLINNIETYSLVPWILNQGAKNFAKIGTSKSRGTKTFALAGKIQRGGLVEVPMGMTIRQIVEEIGGGVRKDYQFKAVQIGGPSGGCIPASMSDIPIEYEELKKYGTMMGSGGLVVLDNTDCMVDIARYFLTFTQAESCGKCTFCRIGTKKMLEILEKICQKKGESQDLAELERLAEFISQGSLCGLGKTSANPILSTLRYFRSEYEAHISGVCPAQKCRNFIQYKVSEKCIGCTKCQQQCTFLAIEGQPYQRHKIDVEKCTRCDLCRQICPQNAIEIEKF